MEIHSNQTVQYVDDEIQLVLEVVILKSTGLGSLHQRIILRVVEGGVLVINTDFNEPCNSSEVPEVEDRVYVRLLLIKWADVDLGQNT